MKAQLLIPAAGIGTRLGRKGPKALVAIERVPLLVRTLERFAPLGLLDGAVVTHPAGYREDFTACLRAAFPAASFSLVEGGAERQASVWNGLCALDAATAIVVIHDAARPFVGGEAVMASCEAARSSGAATVAIPCSDTILEADAGGYLLETPERSRLWVCQTPQTFRVGVIKGAHEYARSHGLCVTDDATLVRRAGGIVKLVLGSPLNLKVTTPEDLVLAELLIRGGLV